MWSVSSINQWAADVSEHKPAAWKRRKAKEADLNCLSKVSQISTSFPNDLWLIWTKTFCNNSAAVACKAKNKIKTKKQKQTKKKLNTLFFCTSLEPFCRNQKGGGTVVFLGGVELFSAGWHVKLLRRSAWSVCCELLRYLGRQPGPWRSCSAAPWLPSATLYPDTCHSRTTAPTASAAPTPRSLDPRRIWADRSLCLIRSGLRRGFGWTVRSWKSCC